jgi:imidazolonepropionase-like amidohydrolase
MPERRSLVFVAFIVAIGVGQSAAAQHLYITNARVLDVRARTETTRNVLIQGGVIVGFPASPPPNYKGPVFDAGGRWVMAALSAMHTHSVGNFMQPGGFQMMGPESVARAAAMQEWLQYQRGQRATDGGTVKTLAAAGVPMVSGTDGGNPAVFQGYSVHRELRLLQKAGLTAWEALAAPTINAGRLLGRKWGIDAGDEATLIVLDGSPLVDMRNTERLHAVIHRGVVVDRNAIRPVAP